MGRTIATTACKRINSEFYFFTLFCKYHLVAGDNY
nr:MAG TPA_asm: hypothetical protein [Caudoviricetes sp.]